MSTGSNDTTQDLTLGAIDACSPTRHDRAKSRLGRVQRSRGTHVVVAAPSSSASPSPDSHQRRSVLSLDDLSNEGKRDAGDNESVDDIHGIKDEDRSPSSERRDGSTRRVEEKLQLNLRQQQEHYARQRKLFEDLRNDSVMATPVSTEGAQDGGNAGVALSAFSSSSHSNDSDHLATENKDSSNRKALNHHRQRRRQSQAKSPTRFQLELESELTGIALKRQSTTARPTSTSHRSRSPLHHQQQHHRKKLDYRNDKDALRELSRVKAKATSDYERRMAETRQSQSRRLRPTVTLAPSPVYDTNAAKPNKKALVFQGADFVQELSQQEASNEALRKQLELLRRLQVENNRFRQDFRACREQNEVLEEQSQLQKRELKRLREDMKELALKIEQDQQSLAAAAQTSRKFKSCQKQLSAAQQEVEKLQSVLHESLELQEQNQVKAIGEMSELAMESKRLKRSLKQIKQQEATVAEENELLRSTIEALESEMSQLKSDLLTQKRETSEISSQLVEKTSHCEEIEASATSCVQQMESGMEALQKTFDTEREKRKKLETQRTSLQTQIEKLGTESQLKQQRVDQLEHHVAQLQERLKERKALLQQQKQSYDEQINELSEKQTQDTKMIMALRSDCDNIEHQLETERSAALDAKKWFTDETRKIRNEVEELRSYIESSLQTCGGGNAAASAAAGAPISIKNANDDDQDIAVSDTENDPPSSSRAAAPVHHHHRHRKKHLHHIEINSQVPPPELQFLQGATSALRTEMMNFVHEFQRSKHAMRQLAKKLKASQERGVELEHLRSQDALKVNDLREQRVLSEQARDITNKEKLEILKWSQQMCEKNEALEGEFKKCSRLVQSLLQKLKHGRERLTSSSDQEEGEDVNDARAHKRKADSPSPSLHQQFKSLESEVEMALTTQQKLSHALEQVSHEYSEQQSEIQALSHGLETKTQEFEQTTAEVEALHMENAREQKARFDALIIELEREKSELADNLHAVNAQSELLASEKKRLEALVDEFEQDVPVFATILHLFVLVVQPLVLQVSELLAQKRFLIRENAEYAQSQEQIECIGQVLKELVPMNAVHQFVTTERQRHKRFRRVVIAVFAFNRFQRCGVLHQQSSSNSSSVFANGESSNSGSFGTCTSLKPPKKRRSGSGSSSSLQRNPPPTAIKVLVPRPTLASLNLRQLLERLKQMGIAEKVADVVETGEAETSSSLPYFGSLIVQVLTAIDPSAKETLSKNTSGLFHCQALLERRRKGRHHKQLGSMENDFDASQELGTEGELSTVDLIRKRILTLGKRVEDLHFQRNSLQKDNYDFQFQLEQQAAHLKQMDVLIQKTNELQDEMQHMRTQNQQQQQHAQQQIDDRQNELELKSREMRAKEDELTCATAQIESLTSEISEFKDKIRALDTEKQELHAEAAKLKLLSIEEEEKSEIAKAGVRKQEEEVRNLKQAARKAHEVYQKMNWQLEQEIAERANLQASVDLLKQQKESLEQDLHDTKLRDLEKSFEGNEIAGSHTEKLTKQKSKVPSKQHKVRFASSHQHQRQEDLQSSNASSSSVDCDRHREHGGNSASKANTFGLELEDTCLYHKYEKQASGSASTVHRDYDDDSSREDDKSDDDLRSSSQNSSSFRLQLSPRSADANNKFLDEWRQLQISSAFDDSDKASRSHHQLQAKSSSKVANASTSKAAASGVAVSTLKQIAREVEIQSNRRRIEIDKVNSAVHDYMDRIDEKLQQMYGIPPSTSSRLRSSEVHGDGDSDESASDADGDDAAGARGKPKVVAHGHLDTKKLVKADETRQVHWYG